MLHWIWIERMPVAAFVVLAALLGRGSEFPELSRDGVAGRSTLISGDHPVMGRDAADTVDQRAAAITLLVYRATALLEDPRPIASYLLAPETTAVPFEVAVSRLAALPKPIECAVRRDRDTLVISCAPIMNSVILRGRAQDVARGVEALGRLARTAQRRDSRAKLIELQAGEDRLALSLNDYERWESDYFLTSPYALATDYADKTRLHDGIGLTMIVLKPGGVRHG